MRQRLLREMQQLEIKVRSGAWPERGMWIETCNVQRDPEFFTKVCMDCRCRYCELSS